MSEQDDPSIRPEPVPLANRYQATPPPVPLPVQPYSNPYGNPYANPYGVPEYMSPSMGMAHAGKPGIITAIGVISIVIASLTLIASGVAAGQATIQTLFVQAGRTMTQVARSQAASAAAQAMASQATPAGPEGLEWDERQTATS